MMTEKILRKSKLTDRQKQAIATHKKIYNTALKLFEKKGFDNVTVNEICRKAQVSKGTFYVYFESKEQVVLDFLEQNDVIVHDLAAGELTAIKDPVDRLMHFMRLALLSQQERGPDIMVVSYRARVALFRSGKGRTLESRSSYKAILSLVEEAQAKGKIRKDMRSADIARLIIRAFDGVVHSWCIVNGSFDLISEAEGMAQVLLGGLRTK
jgi:AcrR family transcriptional regulator